MISRRDFLRALALAGAALPLVGGKAFSYERKVRSLNLCNVHTGERLDITYYDSGAYDQPALGQLNHLLRCHYTNAVRPIDPRVLDLLSDIRETVGGNSDIRIISGYRSPEYNNLLISLGRGVVKDSLHTQGIAIDFAIDGVGTKRLASIAKTFGVGGVGTYPDFVHIDTGRVRFW